MAAELVSRLVGAPKVKEYEWDDHYDFPRDLIGYGEESFNPQWPNGAKIAVSFVINYEEVCLLLDTLPGAILTTSREPRNAS